MPNLWALNNVFYKGSHFPLCFYTKNTGHRSAEGRNRRRIKSQIARIKREEELSHGGGANVGAEPAYVELPTDAKGMTDL